MIAIRKLGFRHCSDRETVVGNGGCSAIMIGKRRDFSVVGGGDLNLLRGLVSFDVFDHVVPVLVFIVQSRGTGDIGDIGHIT